MRCDALVNSLASGTGLPIKVLDALASGLHILASNAGARGLPMRDALNAVTICSAAEDWVVAVQRLSQRKQSGEDLRTDALADLEIIHREIEKSKKNLYEMIMGRLSGVGTNTSLRQVSL